MGRTWIGAIGLVFVMAAFAGSSAVADESSPSSESAAPATLLDESCNSGHVCVWPSANFQGTKGESLCTGGPHPLAGKKFSLKNRCANKKVETRPFVVCVNPGNNNANTVFSFEEIIIGVEGSRC